MAMRLLIITQKINDTDDDLASIILWAKEFMRQGFEVEAICLLRGTFDDSFPVHSLGKERGYGRLRRTFRFLRLIMTLRYDRVFVHMNSEYYTVGGWWWWLLDIPTYLWYTHYTLPLHTRIAARIARRMFAATPESLPQFEGNPKKVVTRHGIDVAFWSEGITPDGTREPETHLLAVHRLCRSKRLELCIRALTHLPDTYTLTVYGREVERDYVAELHELVTREGLTARVMFKGPLPMAELKTVYPRYRLMVNMAKDTIDKTMLEGMLFGIFPVVAPNNARSIGLSLAPASEEPEEIAKFIREGVWKKMPEGELRTLVTTKHSMEELIRTMSEYIRRGT